MYIDIDNIQGMHYYGDMIYMIDTEGQIIKLNPLQSEIVSTILEQSEKEQVILKLEKKLRIDKLTANCMIDQILKIYDEYFKYVSTKSLDDIPVSGEKGKRYPHDITLALTKRCMQRCKHCINYASEFEKTDLPYDDLKKFLNYVCGKVPGILLSGGEPLIYGKINDLLTEYDGFFDFAVTTSGYGLLSLPDSIIKKISVIQLSLHGGNSKQHNEFVQKKDAFEQVDNFIDRVQNNGVRLTVATQAKSENIEELRTIIEYCIQKRIKRVTIGEISPLGRAKKMDIWENYHSETIDNNILSLSKEYHDEIEIAHEENKKIKTNNDFFCCGAGAYKWYVSGEGTIYPCMIAQSSDFNMGSICDDTYKELIGGKRFDLITQEWKKQAINIKSYCENMKGMG